MEKNPQRETELQLAIPNVQVPAIKFIWSKQNLYVQMNIKSTVSISGRISYFRGFLFNVKTQGINVPRFELQNSPETTLSNLMELEINKDSLPKIYLTGEYPTLFHPHFRPVFTIRMLGHTRGEWVDYKEENDDDLEKDLGSYILRVARSLQYEKGYIKSNTNQIGNRKALDYYLNESQRQPEKFPTDNILLPSGKTFKINHSTYTKNQADNTAYTSYNRDSGSQIAQFQQPQRKVKFEITQSQPPYSPIERTQPELVCSPKLNSDFRGSEERCPNRQLYITKSAFKTISDHIEWDRHTNENVVEQGGILLGNAFHDSATGIIYAIAERAIPGKLARGTSGYLEVTHETWKEMLDYVDQLNTGLQVIGWYHTHPNNLDVFMSGTDRATQARLFGNDWQFAIVLNPHKRIWRAFFGSLSHECKGYILSNN